MSVIIDQLRISDNGKKLFLDVHVNTHTYFENVYLDYIVIKKSSQVSETSVNNASITLNSFGVPTNPEEYVFYHKFTGNVKEYHTVISPVDSEISLACSDTTFSKDLYFVYIVTKGTPDSCTPCTLDEQTTLGVTFDESLLYQKVMDYTKSLTADCTIPVGFTDLILLWNAFKASVETEHWCAAIKFYNMLFDENLSTSSGSLSKPCGCNG